MITWDPMGSHIHIWVGRAARDPATHPREQRQRERRQRRERQQRRRERKHGDPP